MILDFQKVIDNHRSNSRGGGNPTLKMDMDLRYIGDQSLLPVSSTTRPTCLKFKVRAK